MRPLHRGNDGPDGGRNWDRPPLVLVSVMLLPPLLTVAESIGATNLLTARYRIALPAVMALVIAAIAFVEEGSRVVSLGSRVGRARIALLLLIYVVVTTRLRR